MIGSLHFNKPESVPNFVTEVSVTFNSAYIKINVSTWGGKRIESVSQCISTITFNTLRELFFCLFNNFFFELRLHHTFGSFCEELIQGNPINEINWIKDIPF